MSKGYLGDFEELVLLTVAMMDGEAYGAPLLGPDLGAEFEIRNIIFHCGFLQFGPLLLLPILFFLRRAVHAERANAPGEGIPHYPEKA